MMPLVLRSGQILSAKPVSPTPSPAYHWKGSTEQGLLYEIQYFSYDRAVNLENFLASPPDLADRADTREASAERQYQVSDPLSRWISRLAPGCPTVVSLGREVDFQMSTVGLKGKVDHPR
jgi:hypothetical protein